MVIRNNKLNSFGIYVTHQLIFQLQGTCSSDYTAKFGRYSITSIYGISSRRSQSVTGDSRALSCASCHRTDEPCQLFCRGWIEVTKTLRKVVVEEGIHNIWATLTQSTVMARDNWATQVI